MDELKVKEEILIAKITIALLNTSNDIFFLNTLISFFPNIKLMVEGNEELISIVEYEKTIDAIDSIVDVHKMARQKGVEDEH